MGSTHGRLTLFWLLRQPLILIAVERMFSMDVLIERACGLDVHKDNITACIITPTGKEIETFSTKPVYLTELVDWLKEPACIHAGLEGKSVYWNPFVNWLEGKDIRCLVWNAQHFKP